MSEGPKPGDIVLFDHAKGLNRLITFLTRSKYYHVAIYAGDDHVVEARPQGVVERDLDGSVGTNYDAYASMDKERGEEALSWAKSKIGDGYDRVGVLVILLDRIFRHFRIHYRPKGKFSCAEFVARAYRHAGLVLFDDLEPEEVVPGDFARLDLRPSPNESQKTTD